jgi:hypothetical protein
MKTRKRRGGHKVFFHHVKSGKIDSPLKARKNVKPDDCAANALFALGIMTESTANHMADKYTVDSGLSCTAMTRLLDNAYPGTTHLWRRVAIDYSNLDRYLEVGEGTIAATFGNSMNHYFVIIRQATGYYVVDTYFKIICTLDNYFEWYTPYWNKHTDVFAIIDSNNPVTEPRPVITPEILRDTLWDDRRNTWSAVALDSTSLWYVTTTDPLPRLREPRASIPVQTPMRTPRTTMTMDTTQPLIPLQPAPGSFAEFAANRGNTLFTRPQAPVSFAAPVGQPHIGPGFSGYVSGANAFARSTPAQGPFMRAGPEQTPFMGKPLSSESIPTELCHILFHNGEWVLQKIINDQIVEIAEIDDAPEESKSLIHAIKSGSFTQFTLFNVHILQNQPDRKLRGVPMSVDDEL